MICRFRKLWIIHHASSVAIPAGRCIKSDDRHEDQGAAICIACICTRVVRVTSKSIDFLPIYTKLCAIMEPINSTTTCIYCLLWLLRDGQGRKKKGRKSSMNGQGQLDSPLFITLAYQPVLPHGLIRINIKLNHISCCNIFYFISHCHVFDIYLIESFICEFVLLISSITHEYVVTHIVDSNFI